jgi:type IV secretion system protein VirB2
MKIQLFAGSTNNVESSRALFNLCSKLVVMAILLMPCAVFAQTGTTACGDVSTYMATVITLLKAISIAVVTIAVIFAGYQIAFAHKRIAEVAPVLIGSVLIGAAGEIASMFITAGTGTC